MKSLVVTSDWDKLWRLFGRRKSIYFLSIAFDLSGEAPFIMPPKEVPETAAFRVRHGDEIKFTLGDGALIFPVRKIKGGLIVYITVCEADRGIRHVGQVMSEVHDQLKNDDGLAKAIKNLVANPGQELVGHILGAATAALQPVATILKNNLDDCEALFTGIYPANGPWDEKLTAKQGGTSIELAQLSG